MTTTQAARSLGRRGGLSRGRRLSKQRLAEIARMGAGARAESLRLAKVIHNNFDYLSAVQRLRPPHEVLAESGAGNMLPGIHDGEAQIQDRPAAAGSPRGGR